MKEYDFVNSFNELKIFLDVIDENSNNILNLITQKYDGKPLSDDENAYLSYIQEEAEEIRKALAAVRNKIGQMLSHL